MELPDDDGGLEVRAGDRGRQHRRAQAQRHHAGDHAAAGRDRGRVPARRACSTSSPATATPAARWSSTRRPRMVVDHRLGAGRHAGRRARPRTTSSGCTSSSAARRRSSSSTTPTSRRRPRASPSPATSTPARTAPPRPACSPRRASTTTSSPRSAEQARSSAQGRAAGRRGRPVRPGQQRRPARPRRRVPRPAARPRLGRRRRDRVGGLGDGYFLEPTVVSGLRQDDEVVQDEIFGPVITVQRFTDEDEAVALGQRRGVRPGVERVDQGLRPGDADAQARSTSAACGSTPTSRSSPRCRTAASSTRGYGKDLSMYGFEDYTRIKHVMANIEP